jgi:glutathione S-transferase
MTYLEATMKNFDRPLRPEDAGAEPIPFETRTKADVESPQSLLPKDQVEELRARWTTIQTGFIDEPRGAVKEADSLVDSAIKQISEAFADQRGQLEKQWTRGDQASTEDLRLALQRYRAFFSRLLSI